MSNKIITTSDGSHTIYIPELDEHYHSIHGAVQESQIIYIKNGYDSCITDPLNIFEVGFGTGLNTLLTALKCNAERRTVFYTSIEKYPLNNEIISLLNYPLLLEGESKDIFHAIHSAPWNRVVNISKYFIIKKIKGDLEDVPLTGFYDLIYFDAFGPDKQPSMWSGEIFKKITSITNNTGIFVTYSAKGMVKRKLKTNGFEVSLLPGPPGKRQMIRAVKI